MRAILFAAWILAGCAQAQGAPASQSTPLSPAAQMIRADLERLDRELGAPDVSAAGLNETADLGGGLTVSPLEVIEDSRCPADVACIWAGRLRLRANVSGEEMELTLGEATQTAHGALAFTIARPSAWASWPAEIRRPAYRFGFRRG